jgi:hypothetical protein
MVTANWIVENGGELGLRVSNVGASLVGIPLAVVAPRDRLAAVLFMTGEAQDWTSDGFHIGRNTWA